MAEKIQKELGITDTGIKANVAGLLAYLMGFITGLIFILIEKKNKFVRFHAMQSIVIFVGLFVLHLVLSAVPIVGTIVSGLISLIAVLLWVILMVKAYQGEMFKLPVVGDFAEKNS